MRHKNLFFSILFITISAHASYCNNTDFRYLDCIVELKNDVLTVENSKIERIFTFNNGHLITTSITNKESGFQWNTTDDAPDMSLPGITGKPVLESFRTYLVEQTLSKEAHVEVEITYKADQLFVKRIIRLYPDCPAIGFDFYFKGNAGKAKWHDQSFIHESLSDVRFVASKKARPRIPVMEKLSLPGKHWTYRVVDLYEMTDHLNDLITVHDYQAYNERLYRGNIFFARNRENDEGLFLLKEAPSPNAQLKYLSGDYLASFGEIRMIGFGIDSLDIDPAVWTPGYSAVTGVFSRDEYSSLKSLRTYQDKLRKRVERRDDMVMMNTWGDRGRDGRINEKYIMEELELCSRLGISHFQIDDGWQTGKSPASIQGGSFDNIWEKNDYWIPDKTNFPSGFTPIMEKGKEHGIEICLWFNPSYTDNYANWEKDAQVLIGLNKEYGIRTFKIDGLRIHDKLSELRVDSLLKKVQKELNDDAVINLDVTADKRFGYLYKSEHGNIFLENRYSDFGSYYPYWSLRNLWKLSKYVPAQNLQIEFLNKWRNQDIYKNDTFAPELYDFDYLFAITMMSQPLAWMEAHNLPEEAFSIGETIEKYRIFQNDIHNGLILPVGEEPTGRSWTGFQSIQENSGYFLIFRESNDRREYLMKTWIEPGSEVELESILGEGDHFTAIIDADGQIPFSLKDKNSYTLYKYKTIK
ncbi:alpha-galactosidase [Proteiniphilum sp. X52]|uniref:alpha-galactosidase n=1 Tax=Proteiniphilum sp. X52 TaxID=2382159 RepID=UPI001314538B|nr:alpha-galactosidase [Proteiniphilum sp. X52]